MDCLAPSVASFVHCCQDMAYLAYQQDPNLAWTQDSQQIDSCSPLGFHQVFPQQTEHMKSIREAINHQRLDGTAVFKILQSMVRAVHIYPGLADKVDAAAQSSRRMVLGRLESNACRHLSRSSHSFLHMITGSINLGSS